jgi:hypothetical protein
VARHLGQRGRAAALGEKLEQLERVDNLTNIHSRQAAAWRFWQLRQGAMLAAFTIMNACGLEATHAAHLYKQMA